MTRPSPWDRYEVWLEYEATDDEVQAHLEAVAEDRSFLARFRAEVTCKEDAG